MSTYEQLKGLKVKYLSADTSGDRLQEGELFYNSSDFSLKSHIAVGAFSAGGNMLTARRAMTGGAGTQTAGLSAGGYVTALMNNTEEYNGNGWASSGNLPTALYYISVAGTQTAGLAVGGGDPVKQETLEYNGSAWTDVGNAPEIRKMLGRAGTQTASLFAGGNDGPNAASSEAFTYDGTNFTNITDLPSNRGAGHVSGGSQTASVHAGGSLGPPGYATTTVEWDGSSWSEGGSYPLPGQNQHSSNPSGYNQMGGGGYLSGPSAITNNTLFYDGSTWSAQANMGTARQQGAGFGSETAAAFCGGTTGSATGATEEFNVTTNTITGAAFASGGNLGTSRRFLGGAGIQTAGLVFGGFQTSPGTNLNQSEEYNGSSWSEGNNLNNARRGIEGFGTQTAAVGVGGFPPPGVKTEEYNGTSWSNGTDFGTVRMNKFGTAGLEPAGLIFSGSETLNTESYDGSSWTEVNNLSTQRSNSTGLGTQTAALCFGGQVPSPANTNLTEEWDGTNWTSGGNLNTAVYGLAGMGTQTSGLALGGYTPDVTNQVEQYNGTSWVTHVSMTTARGAMSSSVPAPSALGLVAGGDTGSPSNATEELTGETTAVNAAKTIDFD